MSHNNGPLRLLKSDETGFTLPELLVSLLLTLFITISLYGLVDMNQRLSRDEQDIVVMQQNGRAGMEFMIRDIHAAGFGLVNEERLNTFGVIFPNKDCANQHDTDSIGIWTYRDGPSCTVTNSMPQPSSELKADDVSEFVEGDWAVIIGEGKDDQFHFDFFTITHVQLSPDHLQHNDDEFSASYKKGSIVLQMDLVRYYLADDGSGTIELMRQIRNQAPAAVATNITSLTFKYYDGNGNEMTNIDTADERKAIRKVEMILGVETERQALDLKQKRAIVLQSVVSPRNLLYLRNES
ncbi:hypothetical protein ACFLU6_05690 [Acidobacteriota bacterium]